MEKFCGAFRLCLNGANIMVTLMNGQLNLSFHTNAGCTRFSSGVLKEKPRVVKTAFFNGCSNEIRSISEAI